jgi:hypothetical protein
MRFRNVEQMIVETVKEAGGTHIAFNPFTERVCVKEALRIVKEARGTIQEAEVRAIVQDVHCDLRNAIQALQLHLVGQRHKAVGTRQRGSAACGATCNSLSEKHARDMGLSLFHALGKILYNKRVNKSGQEIKPVQYVPIYVQMMLISVSA